MHFMHLLVNVPHYSTYHYSTAVVTIPSCTCDLQGVELPTADVTSTEMDSLQQKMCEKYEEIKQLTHFLEAKEAEEERRGGCEELEDELRGKISDLKAQLTEEEDQKMKAEEELKTCRI